MGPRARGIPTDNRSSAQGTHRSVTLLRVPEHVRKSGWEGDAKKEYSLSGFENNCDFMSYLHDAC